MSEEPESLVLRLLRRLDQGQQDMREELREVKHRLTAVENQVSSGLAAEASHYASLSLRMDRLETRSERIERRLDLVGAQP